MPFKKKKKKKKSRIMINILILKSEFINRKCLYIREIGNDLLSLLSFYIKLYKIILNK